MTRYLLRHPLSASLPRKFKIAFAGGGADHAFALVNDLGWHARVETRGGREVRGFRLTVGGGTSLWCQSGRELFEFVPAGDILGVAVAILRVFDARGDRVHRHKNRLRYLIRTMGWEAWRASVDEQWALVQAEGTPPLPFDPELPPSPSPPPETARPPREPDRAYLSLLRGDAPHGPGMVPRFLPVVGDEDGARFLRTNVRPQRQRGYSIVTVTVPLGDLSSGRMRALAQIARDFGEGAVRTTPGQNLVLRWVPDESVALLRSALRAIGLASPDPDSVADVTSCPGAESCKLAVTQSRGLARDLDDSFQADTELVDRAAGLVVKVSGCPNGCGLHHVAGLGFQGGLRKIEGRAAPYYHVYAGGDPGGTTARFGRVIGKLPARRVAEGVRSLVALYEAKRVPGELITAYLGRAPVAELRARLQPSRQRRQARKTSSTSPRSTRSVRRRPKASAWREARHASPPRCTSGARASLPSAWGSRFPLLGCPRASSSSPCPRRSRRPGLLVRLDRLSARRDGALLSCLVRCSGRRERGGLLAQDAAVGD